MDINFLLFEQFETLDLFGPVEICGRHPDFQLHYISQNGGLVTSTQGVRIDTEPQRNMNTSGVLVIPGGAGTRTLIKEEPFLKNLRRLSEDASFVLSVCTGSALSAHLPQNVSPAVWNTYGTKIPTLISLVHKNHPMLNPLHPHYPEPIFVFPEGDFL